MVIGANAAWYRARKLHEREGDIYTKNKEQGPSRTWKGDNRDTKHKKKEKGK